MRADGRLRIVRKNTATALADGFHLQAHHPPYRKLVNILIDMEVKSLAPSPESGAVPF
jgi:hypothetical protein